MFKIIVSVLAGLTISGTALAQEFGFTGGFHNSSASEKNGSGSISSEIGYKLGLALKFPMVDQLNFKTGLIYSYRPFEYSGTSVKAKFAYLDIPVLVEYKFNDMVGVFGGLVMGIKVSDKISTGATPTGMEDIIPLAQVGVSFLFDDLYGFDIYAERGLGDIYDGAKDYTSFGANFVFWTY